MTADHRERARRGDDVVEHELAPRDRDQLGAVGVVMLLREPFRRVDPARNIASPATMRNASLARQAPTSATPAMPSEHDDP